MISILFITVLYFFTRVPLLRSFPVYYDSFEYVRIVEKLNWNNIASIISGSHQPIHTLYFLTALIFKTLLHTSAEIGLAGISLFFGFATCIAWYFIIKKISSEKIALNSTIILLLFPLFFITNTNITYESELLFFQALSFLTLIKGLQNKSNAWLFISGLALGLAHLIFIGTLFLVPIYLLTILNNVNYRLDSPIKGAIARLRGNDYNNTIISFIFIFLGYFITGFAIDYLFLGSFPLIAAKYTSHATDVVSGSQGAIFLIGRILRNIIYQASAILSPGGSFLLLIAILLTAFIKQLSHRKYILLFFISYLVLMQYWHAGLFGRLAVGIAFPASLLITLTFDSLKKQAAVLSLLFIFFATFILIQAQTPPLYQYYSLIKNEKNIAVVTSDYTRFIYEQHSIPHFVIKGDTAVKDIKKYIDTNITKKIVLIDSAALRYPYYQYDGNTYHILSINKKGTALAKDLTKEYSTTKYKEAIGSDIYYLKIGK